LVTIQKIKHVIIIVKENHSFDNYFGSFPGANGIVMPQARNPPILDLANRHNVWMLRHTNAVREQFKENDIPAYFAYARQFTLCDNYFTDVAGPSTPNHLMLIAAASPIIGNPSSGIPSYELPSLPINLENAELSWRNYGGYAFDYINGLQSKQKFTSERFKIDASTGNLPNVSWVYAPHGQSEHPPHNVTVGMQCTVVQVNAVVQGGLWPNSVIFITWDDWGGWFDHVDPPNVEKWNGTHPSMDGTQFRYGSRVGCLVLSPYARSGYISKVLHSHVSLIRFCETTFGLPPLNQRDAKADGMKDCFDFTQQPLAPPQVSA
jgi:phospholipase C